MLLLRKLVERQLSEHKAELSYFLKFPVVTTRGGQKLEKPKPAIRHRKKLEGVALPSESTFAACV